MALCVSFIVNISVHKGKPFVVSWFRFLSCSLFSLCVRARAMLRIFMNWIHDEMIILVWKAHPEYFWLRSSQFLLCVWFIVLLWEKSNAQKQPQKKKLIFSFPFFAVAQNKNNQLYIICFWSSKQCTTKDINATATTTATRIGGWWWQFTWPSSAKRYFGAFALHFWFTFVAKHLPNSFTYISLALFDLQYYCFI